AAFLRVVSRLRGPVPRGRPLHGLWCFSGQKWVGSRSPTPKEKPLDTEAERFHMVYRFKAIRVFGYLSRLKLAQTALTVIFLPPGYYWYSQGLVTFHSLCLLGGTSCFALAMLCWMSSFFQKLVGILYVNESGTVLRVAHLTFWGWRRDTYCPVADVIPLSESKDWAQDVFMRIQQYSGQHTFYLSLRYGHVVDRARFSQVFGNLAELK
uniref:Transmembrane protein 186 n=2 Tax=Jaculus jaculus TaxID=51337 RepID=A0A8C5LA21_JACJA